MIASIPARTVLLVTALLGLTATASAQTLRSETSGLRFELRGPIRLHSETDLDLQTLPAGNYELLTRGPSTLTTRNRLQRTASGVELSPRANATSLLLPPGLVELLHHDQRGWVYLGTGAASTGLWWWSNNTADNAEEAINSARNRRVAAMNATDRLAATLDERDARDQFTDDNRLRKIWLGYIGGLWLGSAIDSWLFTPQATMSPDGEDGYQLGLPLRSGRGAALRSALIPGSGQRSVGRDARANFFLTAFLSSTAASLVAQDAFLSARRDVSSAERRLAAATTPEDEARWRQELEDSRNTEDDLSLVRWVLLGTSAYVYVWNIIDAYRVGRPESPEGPQFSLTPTRDGARFAVSWLLN